MEGNNQNRPDHPRWGRIAFDIVMICVYLGVGILFILNIFDTIDQTVSIIVGCILIVYAIWRGIRLYKGWN